MALSDYFNNATVSTRPDAGALTAQKLIAASSITVDTTAGWPVSPDSVHFIIYQVDASGNKVAGTQTDWKGTVTSSTAIGSLTLKAGTDQIYPVGSKVIATPTGAWADDMVTGLLVAHEQDGTLKAGAVDVTAVIADGVVTRAKLATAVTTELNDGWTTPTQTVSSVTNNGNRSYDVVFNSTVASVLSPGMRLRTTRTVTAPTYMGGLFNGSSHYFTKVTPTSTLSTVANNFTIMGWVEPTSYVDSTVAGRYDSSANNGFELRTFSNGQIGVQVTNGGSANYRYVQTYQSLPLNKKTHVAASWTSGTVVIYLDGVSVPVATATTSGTAPTTAGTGGDFSIGRRGANANLYFPGYLSNVAVFDAVLTASTIRSYMSQVLSGSETNCIGAWSLNNTGVNQQAAGTNDLTATGGVSYTSGRSPYGTDSNGVSTGTTDYALVMKVSTTTATVQVPEGCTIPTSGGVSAVAYSTATSPFGFTLDKVRWEVGTYIRVNTTQSSPVQNTWYNLTSTSGVAGGSVLTVPVGAWASIEYKAHAQMTGTTNTVISNTLSTTNNTETDTDYTERFGQAGAISSMSQTTGRYKSAYLTTATAYYLNTKTDQTGGTTIGNNGASGTTIIKAIPAGI